MNVTACRPGGIPVIVGRVLAALLCLALMPAMPARAQFAEVRTTEQLPTEHVANLFASWTGHDPVQGVVVELPSGWRLKAASVLRYGYEPIPVQTEHGARNQYVVTAARPLHGPHELVFQVETGAVPGRAEWSLVPFTRPASTRSGSLLTREAYRVTRPILLTLEETLTDNQVLSFDPAERTDENPALVLRHSALPDLGLRAAYTVAFWMKTSRLDQVVLSTWNGDERRSYPLELVVDRSGRLLFYRGQPGRHQSMTSQQPVADSRWHYITLTNDAEQGWARLYVDGRAVDSLYSAAPLPIDFRAGLAVGGRLSGGPRSATAPAPYTGQIDELSILPGARPATTIRTAMRQPAGTTELRSAEKGLRLGFEERIPSGIAERRPARIERTGSDLLFYHPVRNLRAAAEAHTVQLTWESADEQTAAFVIERSMDGRHFEETGRVTPAEAEQGRYYRFLDLAAVRQVLFYRIRQTFQSGSERLSGAIKLGLGDEELPSVATLVGNFPNPFNTGTTVTYEVREAAHVRLSVWDLSGQQITMLVDEEKGPGTYEVQFQADDLPSGTYFVRLATSFGMQSHKMILMK